MAIARDLLRPRVLSVREKKLSGYLEGVARQGLISSDMLDDTWGAWGELTMALSGLAVPDACPGPDGSLLFTWDRGEHHLELEFPAAEPPSFFYVNRETGVLWEALYDAGRPLSDEVKAKLALFITKT